MPKESDLSPGQLVDLVRDDQRRHWLRGEPVFVETYLQRYPSLDDDPSGVMDCVYGEFLLREELGETPRPEDYLARFPSFADQLRRQFEVHAALGPDFDVEALDAVDSIDESDTATVTATPSEQPRRFGDYELIEEISRGGMGVVFKARQVSLNRTVALKLILGGGFAGPEHVERFRREAEAAAGSRHPNIVAVYEVGECDGQNYFTMDYIEGESLAEVRRTRRMAPREAAACVRTLAEAVQYVHEQGTLHRDLKPSNVLIDKAGQPHITDFGLAKYIRGDAELTSSGTLVGTPSYMSPEAASGKGDKVGPASDVYSLGAILYELLTDRLPFVGDTPLETLWQVLHSDPTAPRLVNPRVSRDLETICLKCLEKQPRRRYESAAALADDLKSFMAGKPTVARPLGVAGRLWRWAQRKPTAAALVAVSFVALLTAFIGGAWHAATLRSALDVAEQRRIEAQNLGTLANAREQRVREYLYAADMKLADEALKKADVAQVIEILNRYRGDKAAEKLRTFAWYRLWALCNRHSLELTGHVGDVYGVDFSPDGSLIASCGHDGTVRLWDAETGQQRNVLRGHDGDVNNVCFSPDGHLLATCSDDQAVRLWDAFSGELVAELVGHTATVFTVAFSPDGKLLASGSLDRSVKLWNVATKSEVRTLSGHTGGVESLAFSPDGEQLATTSGDFTIKLWSVDDGQETTTLAGHEGVVLCVAFSPDGRTLASGSEDHTVKLWDIKSGQQIDTLAGDAEVIQSIAFSPDGCLLAAAIKDGTVRFWSLRNETTNADDAGESTPPHRIVAEADGQLWGHPGRIWKVAFSPDGQRLVTSSGDGTVRVWSPSARHDGQQLVHIDTWSGIQSLAFSAERRQFVGAILARRSGVGMFVQWLNIAADAPERGEQDRGHEVQVAISSDGRHVAQVYAKGDAMQVLDLPHTVEIVNPASGEIESTMRGVITRNKLSGTCCRSACSSGGRYVALGFANNGTLELWDTKAHVQRKLVGYTDSISALAFSPDGAVLASGGEDHSVIIWNVASASRQAVLAGHRAAVHAVAFSPDGHILATGSSDRTLILWDIAQQTRLATLQAHDDGVESAAFSPDGRTIASGAANGIVKLWDVATLEEVGSWPAHVGPVTAAVFSSDGRSLATGRNTLEGGCDVMLWQTDEPFDKSCIANATCRDGVREP